MAYYWFCTFLFHVLIPVTILFVVLLRPTFTSYTYLIVGCLCPMFPAPDEATMKGKSGVFLKIFILTAILNTVMFFAVFTIVYYPKYHLENSATNNYCDNVEKVLRQLGYVNFLNLPSTSSHFTWLAPEVIMLTTSVFFYFIIKKFTKGSRELSLTEEMGLSEVELTKDTEKTELFRQRKKKRLSNIGKCVITLLLCCASIVRPSIFGAAYFFLFLCIITWWGFYRKLKLAFAISTLMLLPLLFVHMSTIYAYQFQFVQENVDAEGLLTRLFNVVPFMSIKDCNNPGEWAVEAPEWVYECIVFVGLYTLFCLIIHVAKQIFYDRKVEKELQANKWKKTLTMLKQKKTEEERLAEERAEMTEEELESRKWRQKIINFCQGMFSYVIQMSFLLCNFVLMIWGIGYLGWKTSVFLLLANTVWLFPNQKYIIHIFSPVVLLWVWFIMVTAYIYSMRLNKAELPTHTSIMNWASGVKEFVKNPFVDIFVQSLFTIICAVCLRQFMHERAMKKQRDDLVAVAGETDAKIDLQDAELFDRFQIPFYAKRQLALYFIWILGVYIATITFWGNITPIRAPYLLFTILLVLSFELLPFRIWKKFLWFYWWTCVIYAMFHLTIRYLYQYDFLREFACENEKMEFFFHSVLMFHKQSTWYLFTRLIAPVTLIILLVIQIHYFQRIFNRITDPDTEYYILAEDTLPEKSDEDTTYLKAKRFYFKAKNFICLVCEFHLRKFILILVMWEIVDHEGALYFPIVIMITVYPFMGRHVLDNCVFHIISVYFQVFFVVKVLYMGFYSSHKDHDVTCYFMRDNKNTSIVDNTMTWLGLARLSSKKVVDADHTHITGETPIRYFAVELLFLVLICIDKAIRVRQTNVRKFRGQPVGRPDVIFPGITVDNREESLPNMIKYFCNYGFYKFGVELSFITIAFGMWMRMDLFFMVHGIILLLIFALPRKYLARVWLPLMVLFNGLIPYQYFHSIGWLPSKCTISSFWNRNDIYIRTQKLLFMRNDAYPPISEKIFLDFLILLVMNRQWRVFLVERKNKGQPHPGGSNEDVTHFIEDKEFVNPVPDFITNQRNYLDALKKIVLCHTYYMTLIFMYLAGTENIGTYSFIYIILSIVYLWSGAEIFLYPIKSVLRRINLMIVYTITVMLLRMLNQLYSCVFIFQNIGLKCYWQYPFAFHCSDRFGDYHDVPNLKSDPMCKYHDAKLGMFWDWFVFCLLLFQRRLILSYNFFHIVNDVKLYTILASRGAYFIHTLRLKKIKDFEDEKQLIQKTIAEKLTRIEANHRKIQGERYLQQRKKRHKATVRSGDYYLFDDLSKNDVSIVPPKPPVDELDESDPLDPLPFGQLLLLLVRTNAGIVLDERKLRQNMKKEQMESAISAKRADNAKTNLPIVHATSSLLKAQKSEKLSRWQKIKKTLTLILAMLESTTVSLTLLFNKHSKEYRLVVQQMYKERLKILKTPYKFGQRNPSQRYYWQPTRDYEEYDPTNMKDDPPDDSRNMTYNIYGKLIIALYYFLISSTEWLCYLMIIMNQLLWNNFFTIMLPIIVFCWGALTTPKPTRTFWITVIYYVLVMVIVKAVFAIPYFEYNKRETTDPFYPPFLMGLSRNFEIYFTLCFFLLLFLHRSVLKSMGLWKPIDHRKTYLRDGEYNLDGEKLVLAKDEEGPTRPGPSRPRGTPAGTQSFSIQSTQIPFATYFPRSLVLGLIKYGEGIRSFFQNLIEPQFSAPKDYYTLMFFSDLVGLLIIMFSFESFHSDSDSNDGLYDYLVENRIPGVFVLIILLQFSIMLIDRGIYLRKNRLMKLIFNTVLVVIYHIWLNIMVPLYTNKLMIVNSRVQAFYFFKCIYMLVSACQVAVGYPPRILSHCLWHSFSVFNRITYTMYLKIPYFFHIRAAVDWTFTDTTLSFMDWFKMEEISSTVFEQKCQQEFESTFIHEAGTQRNRTVKYIMGFSIVLGLWMVIIAPLALFSMGQSVGKAVEIRQVEVDIRMARYEPIYKGYAVDSRIHTFTKDEYNKIQIIFSNMKSSRKVFRDYTAEDVHSIKFSPRSSTNWGISAADLIRMRKMIKRNEPLNVRLSFSILVGVPSGEERIQHTNTFIIPPLPDKNRQNLLKMIMHDKTAKPLRFKRYWPKFLELTREKEAKVIDGLLEENKKGHSNSHRHLLLKLRHFKDKMWWEIREECNENDINYYRYLQNIATSTCDDMVLFTFSEKHFPSILGSITSNGILGMYLLYFFMIYDIVSDFFVKIEEIWIEDMPYCDRIWNKCLEIYVARDMGNFNMEEEMVAELIFIMRSPEMIIKLTAEVTED